jgi:hypothetical protein
MHSPCGVTDTKGFGDQIERILFYNRWLCRGLLSTAVLLCVVIAGGWQVKDVRGTIKANRIEIIDAKGILRASISVDEADAGPMVGINLNDQRGRERLRFGVTPDGDSIIAFCDEDLKERMALQALTDGRTGLTMYDQSGVETVALAAKKTGVGLSFVKYSDRDAIQLVVGAKPSGRSGLWAFRNETKALLESIKRGSAPGDEIVSLEVEPRTGGAELRLSDSQGTHRLHAVVTPDGKAGLQIRDSRGIRSSIMGVSADGSVVRELIK